MFGECVVDGLDEPTVVADAVTFRPVYIRQSAYCSTLSMVGPVDRANERLIGTTEWGLGRLLADGLDGLNPSFADASIADIDAGNAVDAVACLEHAIADTGYGNRAFLHTSYRAAAYLKTTKMIDDDDRSPSGHQWIISAGYPTAAPDSAAIWATGPVWAAVSGVEAMGTIDYMVNTDAAFSQRLALAAFDPCINLVATFDVPTCSGVS